jgi:hypothetical protein
MSVSFILAGIIIAVTIALLWFEVAAVGMSTTGLMTDAQRSMMHWTAGIGFGFAAFLIATHWLRLHW